MINPGNIMFLRIFLSFIKDHYMSYGIFRPGDCSGTPVNSGTARSVRDGSGSCRFTYASPARTTLPEAKPGYMEETRGPGPAQSRER